MIDKDYRYHIYTQKGTKSHRRKKKHPSWIIILACISILSAGVVLTLYGREAPAYPTRPLTQVDHPNLDNLGALPSPPQAPAPITKEAPAAKAIAREQHSWQNIIIKWGDNLSLIFSKAGLSPRQLHAVMSLGKPVQPLEHLQPGQLLQLTFKENTEPRQLAALRLHVSPIEYLEVRATGDNFQAKHLFRKTETHAKIVTGTIERSLFEDGLQAGLTDKQIMELTYIFGWDIDFALDLRAGDSFKVLFEEHYLRRKKVQNGPILAAEFTNHGKTYRAVRYTNANHHTGYYTPEGASMRKAFLRTPVNYTRISSPFNLQRKHPILNRIRAHTGVDYAAPTGTPVKASGEGKVVFIGRKGGYGKAIVLQHGTKYSTLYGHLSRFKQGLREGAKVNQGEVIGYVGQTGLATGPHLHYEFRVNGVHRDPLTVKLPRANPIPSHYQQDFQRHAASLAARLDATGTSTVVLNQ